MSKFYDEIALYYDAIFPVQKGKLNLIRDHLSQKKSDVLDLACGTGGYAIEISKLGHRLTAIDLDEIMIQELNNKGYDIDAKVMNMLDIGLLHKSFDFIYCLGNSIVHLDSLAEVETFFKECYKILKPGGQILFQIINYDRILDQGIDHLPTIYNEEPPLSFERNYSYIQEEHKIAFHTRLQVNGPALENTVKLLPIRHKELLNALSSAGFHKIRTYGDFMKQDFDLQKSVPCIMVANK